MPIIQGNLKSAMYVLQEHCKYSDCQSCEIRRQCFEGYLNNPADFDISPATLVLGCVDKDVCSEYITMKAQLSKKIRTLEEENRVLKSQLEYSVVMREALEKQLDSISPGWRKKKEASYESA